LEAKSGPVAAPVPTEIDATAMTVPTSDAPVLMVAELPTAQNTFFAAFPAAFRMTTLAPTATVSVEPIWKTQQAEGSPLASRDRVPVRPMDEADE
jgi:hypothetical protein